MTSRKLETYERGKQDSDELESYQDPPREKVSKRTRRNYISIGNSTKRVHFYCSVYVCVCIMEGCVLHTMHVADMGNFVGMPSSTRLWSSRIELRSPGLNTKYFYRRRIIMLVQMQCSMLEFS